MARYKRGSRKCRSTVCFSTFFIAAVNRLLGVFSYDKLIYIKKNTNGLTYGIDGFSYDKPFFPAINKVRIVCFCIYYVQNMQGLPNGAQDINSHVIRQQTNERIKEKRNWN